MSPGPLERWFVGRRVCVAVRHSPLELYPRMNVETVRRGCGMAIADLERHIRCRPVPSFRKWVRRQAHPAPLLLIHCIGERLSDQGQLGLNTLRHDA